MSSGTAHAAEVPPQSPGAPGAPQQEGTTPLANFTFTFPIVYITNAPASAAADGSPPEYIQHVLHQFLRAMPMPFTTGQYEPVPQGPPKKHATPSAIKDLQPVSVATLSESERSCHICMQNYALPSSVPRSPYVEDVRDEDVREPTAAMLIAQDNADGVSDTEKNGCETGKEEGETPLQMPCGHIFGSACLKEWLYHSPTCPLCRVEVESYTDEPEYASVPIPQWMFPSEEPEPPQSGVPPPSQSATSSSETTEEMQDTTSDLSQNDEATNLPHLAFQFIFTSPPPLSPTPPPPSSTSSQSTTPHHTPSRQPTPHPSAWISTGASISRPTSAHNARRHHPYARNPAQSPFYTSVRDRPDLFCAQRQSGLCEHDPTEEGLVRLECGHAFHNDCLEGAMAIEGYPIVDEQRRCPRCRRWMSILQ